jgi:uncharacterized protein (TIGR02996 family)
MREQLVQAVIADPDADAPRQAFAAWGVQHGDLQAELTRIQLAEAHERRVGTTTDANRLFADAQALIEQHGAVWAREVLAIASHPRFFRGFVEAVVLDVPTFLNRATELYSIAPIRSVVFVDAGPHIDALAASPHLARLVSMEFYNRSQSAPLGDAGLRALVQSPHLGKLTLLQLAWNEITRDAVEALAASKMAPSLRDVALGNNPVGKVVEQYAEDPFSFEIVRNSISLPPLGRELEAKYGPLPWLHGPSLFRMFPPTLHDI